MSKSWTDRADRDLFFAILSHKQLGVVSGAEWAAIGRDMRARGYGFTNEGCRQHFQGLRRGQGEPIGVGVGVAVPGVGGDPSQNPITRRPGKRQAGSPRPGTATSVEGGVVDVVDVEGTVEGTMEETVEETGTSGAEVNRSTGVNGPQTQPVHSPAVDDDLVLFVSEPGEEDHSADLLAEASGTDENGQRKRRRVEDGDYGGGSTENDSATASTTTMYLSMDG